MRIDGVRPGLETLVHWGCARGMSGKVLIKDGTVLSLDRAVGNMTSADVLVEDGIITEVGTSLRARNAVIVEASNAIVMPGFVDTHRHTWHSLFRNLGRGPASTSPEMLGRHYTPDHVYAATLVGLLGAVEAGITTVVDWADIPMSAKFIEAALQAHADAGMRTVLVAAGAGWDGAARRSDAARAVAEQGRRPNVTFAFGSKDPAGAGVDAITRDWTTARRGGLRIHLHVGAGAAPRGMVARLGEAGLLGEDVTLVHCTNLDEDDLDAIASAKAQVSLTPVTEMTGGLGSPPLQSLIDRGIRPGLGIGSEMEAPGDMFAQMRAANSVQHATLFDLKLAGKGGVPNLLNTRDVIRYSTIDGAKVAGLETITGTLTPGKSADIIVLRTDRPNIAPVNDPIGAVVWGMDTSNIDWVLVGGRALVEHGELVADVERARDLAFAAQREVATAAGLLADAGLEQP